MILVLCEGALHRGGEEGMAGACVTSHIASVVRKQRDGGVGAFLVLLFSVSPSP